MIEVFVPTFSADLDQIAVLLKSLARHLDLDAVASLNIAAIGDAASFTMVSRLDTRKFQPLTRYLRPEDLGFREPDGSWEQGWSLQQAAKLVFARQAKTEFYMVLDSKNIVLRPVVASDLIVNGRAPWVLEDAANHLEWWRGAAWALGHRRFDRQPHRQALSAATPVILHTSSVLAMLERLETRHRESVEEFLLKRRPIRSRFMRATEFAMYYVFLDMEGLSDRHHFASTTLHDTALQIWTEHSPEERRHRFERIVAGKAVGLFTGIQRGAWASLTDKEKERL